MVEDTAMSASQNAQAYNKLEIDSAVPELRTLLIMLQDVGVSLDSIKEEMKRVHLSNSTHLKDYVVPYSGMFIIFYVVHRLAKRTAEADKAEGGCIELFRMLITEYGANPNSLDGVMKQTVLFYTSKCGALTCCKELVNSFGVNPGISDIHCQTALFYAAREGMSDVVAWLVKGAGCDVNHVDRNGQTALFYAAREDKLDCVMMMINELHADPLVRDIYKKRARGYLKPQPQKRTFDFLTEIEKARDPTFTSSHRKLFLVRPDEPVGAAAMTLRQHKPYNPYVDESVAAPAIPAAPAVKRQRSSLSGASTPANGLARSVASTVAKPTPIPSPRLPGRSRFKVKAPLGKGGLESFEKDFPEFALWLNNISPNSAPVSPPAKAPSRTPRAPAPGLTPQWVTVVSQLLRGPLWRYGPATIFHKPVLALPANLGPKYQTSASGEPEKKLSIDLSLVRKKLEKGKYLRMTEIDRDIRAMFSQAYALVGGTESDLGILTKATEVYYEQQLAGCGLAAVVRQEAEDLARAARASVVEMALQPDQGQSMSLETK